MPSLVIAGFKRRSANSSNPFCDSHISIIRKPVSVGWEMCWYIPGSGRASTPISSSIARNSLWVKPVTFIVITTIVILFLIFLFLLILYHRAHTLPPAPGRNRDCMLALQDCAAGACVYIRRRGLLV